MQKKKVPRVTRAEVDMVKRDFSPAEIDAMVKAADTAGISEDEKLNLLPLYVAATERKKPKKKK